MQHEFRGITLQDTVRQALEYKDATQCRRLSSELADYRAQLSQSENRFARLERTIQRLHDDIENDKETFDHDDVARLVQVAAALATLIPIFGAVRLGIGAVIVGVSVARAIKNGQTLGSTITAAIGTVSGINLLTKPSDESRLKNLESDSNDELKRTQRLNDNINGILEAMQRNGCTSIT